MAVNKTADHQEDLILSCSTDGGCAGDGPPDENQTDNDYMQELKTQKIWVLWSMRQNRDGRPTKVPHAAGGGATGTDGAHSGTWVTYEEAARAAKSAKASGVGFVIPEGYFFLDIDHRDPDDSLVQELLARFGSYAEYSVSGNGIHIYGSCDMERIPTYVNTNGKKKLANEFYQKNPNNGMELYFGSLTDRFAVFTGNAVSEMPLKDCTEALLKTLDQDMRRYRAENLPAAVKSRENPEDIVRALKSQKNAKKFRKLYEDGDISDYGTHSDADCALCEMIAFRTGPDPEMVDQIFRTSALYREKWEREDYREATIERGIGYCGGKYHYTKMEHPDFIRFREKSGEPYVSAALLAKHIREDLPYILVRDNAKQGILKYVYGDGVYRLYSDDMLQGVIKGYIAEYDEELIRMPLVNEVLLNLSTDLDYVRQDMLNADETLINFKNTLLKVTADGITVLPHTPDVYSTIQIPCEWTGCPVDTPVFDAYMDTLTDHDEDVAGLLLEVLGVVLSGVKAWRMKKALFMVGPGDSGKSVLKSLAERLIGRGNFIGIDLREIEARFGTGAIYGTRLAGSSDMSFLTVNELKTFKKITGGDSLFAEFKGRQAFEFTYSGFLWFCMNRLPKFGGDDGKWVYDRIMVVHCPNSIPEAEQDRQLIDKLYAEREGIVYKAVMALQTVLRNGYRFSEPQCVTDAGEQYMADNNTVIAFYKECMCERESGGYTDYWTADNIYRVYRRWCSMNNNGYAKTLKEFRTGIADILGSAYKDLTKHGLKGTYYKNLTLTADTLQQYDRDYDDGRILADD